jgi:hypothetical protein
MLLALNSLTLYLFSHLLTIHPVSPTQITILHLKLNLKFGVIFWFGGQPGVSSVLWC